jgi:hypothetical protein
VPARARPLPSRRRLNAASPRPSAGGSADDQQGLAEGRACLDRRVRVVRALEPLGRADSRSAIVRITSLVTLVGAEHSDRNDGAGRNASGRRGFDLIADIDRALM